MIKKIENAVNIPSEELEDWGIPKTIGEPKWSMSNISRFRIGGI